MEELLQLIVVIIVAGIGIASKAANGKKKPQKKATSPWDEISNKIAAGLDKMNELIEDEDETPVRKPVMPQKAVEPVVTVSQAVVPTVIISQPAAAPEPAVIPVMYSDEGEKSGEGDCDHPLHAPVEIPKTMPRLAMEHVKPAPAMEIERVAVHSSAAIPGRVTAERLRQAVVISEVLGKPVALKGAARR